MQGKNLELGDNQRLQNARWNTGAGTVPRARREQPATVSPEESSIWECIGNRQSSIMEPLVKRNALAQLPIEDGRLRSATRNCHRSDVIDRLDRRNTLKLTL